MKFKALLFILILITGMKSTSCAQVDFCKNRNIVSGHWVKTGPVSFLLPDNFAEEKVPIKDNFRWKFQSPGKTVTVENGIYLPDFSELRVKYQKYNKYYEKEMKIESINVIYYSFVFQTEQEVSKALNGVFIPASEKSQKTYINIEEESTDSQKIYQDIICTIKFNDKAE